jgi:hypothetical protein
VTDCQALATLISGGNPPRAIVALCSCQESLTALNRRLPAIDAGQGKRIKALTGGQGIAPTILELAPAAVGFLLLEKLLDKRCNVLRLTEALGDLRP